MSKCPKCGRTWRYPSTERLKDTTDQCPLCALSTRSIRQDNPTSKEMINSLDRGYPSDQSFSSRSSVSPSSLVQGAYSEESECVLGTSAHPAHREMAELFELSQKEDSAIRNADMPPSPDEGKEAALQFIRKKGFVIQEDVHGLRLGGIPTRRSNLETTKSASLANFLFRLSGIFSKRSSPISELSPTDIVRLAAELEGGLLPIEKREHCPRCDAVVGPSDKRCQWCSEPLSS